MRTRSHAALTLGLALLAVAVFRTPSTAGPPGPPGQFQFQSRLTDAQGKPLADGTVTVTFKIYATDPGAGGTPPSVWSETQQNVPITRGILSVQLGSVTAIGASIFDGQTKYLEVTVAGSPPLRPTIPLVSVPYALNAGSINGKSDVQIGTPIGTIVDWLPPQPGASPPDGWLVCDGSVVNDAAAGPYNGQQLPDLRGKVTRGVDAVNQATLAPGNYADKGGSDSQQVNVTHDHGVPSHTHSIPAHSHTFLGKSTSVPVPNTSDPTLVTGVSHLDFGLDHHVHTLPDTDAAPATTTGPSAAGRTDTATLVVTVDTRPKYVGLLKIIRVR